MLALSGQLAWVVNKFDDGHFGIVAAAMAEFDNAGVTAVTVFIARSELIEKPLDGFYAGGSLDRIFRLALISAKTALLSLECAVAGVKKSCRLTTKMNSAKHGVVAASDLPPFSPA